MGRGGDFAPCRGHLAVSGDVLLVYRSQECCKTSYSAQNSTPLLSNNHLGQNNNSAKVVAESKDKWLQKLLKGLSMNQSSFY